MLLRRFTVSAGCFVMGVFLAAWVVRTSAPALAEEKPAAADATSGKALLDAAKGAYDAYIQRRRFDARTPFDPEYLYRWSRRWLDAERAVNKARDRQVAAYAAHLERMRWLEGVQEQMIKSAEAAPSDLAAVKFYRIEAERWLAEAKSG